MHQRWTRSHTTRATVTLSLTSFFAALLFAPPAHALPTPDALLGVAQLLPILLSALLAGMSAISLAVWRLVHRRKNPLVFMMRVCIVLLVTLVATAAYAIYLQTVVAGEALRLNTAAYLRGDPTLQQFHTEKRPKIIALVKSVATEISYADLDARVRADATYHPVLYTATRHRSRAIYDAGTVGVGLPGQEQLFMLSNDLGAELASIPADERATRDLVLEGSSIQFFIYPPDDAARELFKSFHAVFYTPMQFGFTREPKDRMFVRAADGSLVRPNVEASGTLTYPVMDESRIYPDALTVQFPNWMTLLTVDEFLPLVNMYDDPDVLVITPTVGYQRGVRTTAYLLTHILPGRFPPHTFSHDNPRAALDLTAAFEKDPMTFGRHGLYIVDYGAKDLQAEIKRVVEVVRGKKFVIVGLSRTDWVVPGVDFAYQVYLDSKAHGAPFQYLGSTLVADVAGATTLAQLAGVEQSPLKGAQKATAAFLSEMTPRVGSLGLVIALLAFAVWLVTLPVAILGGRASLWRRMRDRRAEGQTYLAGMNVLQSGSHKLSKRWETVETAVAVILLFPGFTLLVAPESPVHGTPWYWVQDLGKPDLVLSIVVTLVIWARVAFLRVLGPKSSPAKIAGEAALFIGFAVLCVFFVPSAIALYASVLSLLRLLTVLPLASLAKKAMTNVAEIRNDPAPQPRAEQPYFERFRDITRLEACGGKAKNLAILARLSSSLFEVPDGLVVYLDKLAPSSPEFDARVKECVRATLPNTTLFSVRSTSTTEDSELASEAGKYLSLLNVAIDDVPNAIRRVYDSYVVKGSSGAGVIVQTMVDARIAGVAFSTAPDNPVVTAVEYVDGLGEGLVSGEKTPGSILYSRATGEVVFFDREVPAAAEKIFLAAMLLEQVFGRPQDMEWAVAGETLYLLQARPITKYVHEESVVAEQRRVIAIGGKARWKLLDISEIVDNPSRFTLSVLERVYSENGALGRSLSALGLAAGGFKTNVILGRLYSRTDTAPGVVGAVAGAFRSRSARGAVLSSAAAFRAKVTAELRPDRVQDYTTKAKSMTDAEVASTTLALLEAFEQEIYPVAFEATLRAGLAGSEKSLVRPVRTVASDFYQALATLCRTNDHPAFAAQWGHRSSSDYDLAVPSFGEDAALANDFASTFAGYMETAQETPGEPNAYQIYVQMKELTKDYSVRYLRQVRPLLLELARRNGLEPADVFALTQDELQRLPAMAAADRQRAVKAAREAVAAFAAIELPEIVSIKEIEALGRVTPTPGEAAPTGDRLSGKMLGAAKPFSGPAVGAGERDRARLSGAVLLTMNLKPELVGLFDQIGGIITKQGGVLSHAAIVAREKGIPVVRLEHGFERLTPGMQLVVSESGDVSIATDGEQRKAATG